jgi:uncharacterized protein YjiS (DUF1127 family)
MTTVVANTFNQAGIASVFNWIKKAINEHQRRKLIRFTIKELNQLSNRELNDIGLTRCDIWHIANSSYPKGTTVSSVTRNVRGWA